MSTAIKNKCENIHHFYQPENMYDLCSKLEIPILQTDLMEWESLLQYHYNQFIIHLDKQTTYKEVSIASEIGHFFLHSQSTQFKTSNSSISLTKRQRAEGIFFATELLITDDDLIGEMFTIDKLNDDEVAGYFNVPLFILQQKINALNTTYETKKYLFHPNKSNDRR